MAGGANLTVASIPFPKTFDSTLSAQVAISGANLPAPGESSVSANGGAFTFAAGSTGADFLQAADLSAILPDGPLKQLLAKTYVDIPAGQTAAQQFANAIINLGALLQPIDGANGISPDCVSGSRPRFNVTTTAATGILFIKTLASVIK